MEVPRCASVLSRRQQISGEQAGGYGASSL